MLSKLMVPLDWIGYNVVFTRNWQCYIIYFSFWNRNRSFLYKYVYSCLLCPFSSYKIRLLTFNCKNGTERLAPHIGSLLNHMAIISIIHQNLISTAKNNIMYNLVYYVYTILNFCIVTRTQKQGQENFNIWLIKCNILISKYEKRYACKETTSKMVAWLLPVERFWFWFSYSIKLKLVLGERCLGITIYAIV